jgi:hypothetical protein
MFKKIAILFLSILTMSLNAQRLKVSDNGRFLVTEEGKPFFWLADTAWELFHRVNKEEAEVYLRKRAEQGFNVIQAVALAELDGLNTPNPNGDLPLINNDPAKPNGKYFEHVDYIIKKADELGIYIALLPTWGDKLFKNSWGVGPEIFNPQNATAFGKWIGNRYKDYDNVIWVLGGDRNPRDNSKDIEVWNNMAVAIQNAARTTSNEPLMSYHPQPKEAGGSSTWFHKESWLDFNMHQTGHCPNQGTYKHISNDYNLKPTKPVIDSEPLYEDHPNCFNVREQGYSEADDIRRIMYWNVFAGAFGQTYGNHAVWQMYKLDKEPINSPARPWPMALDMPMANQVKHLKNLMLSRPFLTRIPDQKMIIGEQPEDNNYTIATRDEKGRYAMIYFPLGSIKELNLSALNGSELNAHWFDPRTGNTFKVDAIKKSSKVIITPPTSGKGNDWVLLLDSTGENFDRSGR